MTSRSINAAFAAFILACAGTQIGNPDDYEPVELNRVYPYPSDQELGKQKTEVILATRFTRELPEETVGQSMAAVRSHLERFLTEAGAGVIDRSIHDLKEIRDELEAAEKGGGSGKFAGADWAVISRMTRFRHWSTYDPPSGLFKSEEELAAEPGTCTHFGEVEVDIKAFKIPTDDVARTTFRIHNTGEFEDDQFDQECPIEDTRKLVFLEDILEKALPCLDISIKNRFSPRGYIDKHRVSVAGNTHIFRTSLGAANGAKAGLELMVFRTQYMTTGDGREAREERRIGAATVTDEIGQDYSWVSVDIGNLTQPILAGDVVRAVYADTMMAGLGFGACSNVLTIEGIE